VPVETAYNQWTQFEDWPKFMHRVTRVTQEDDCTVSFATKIWGKTKEFEAKIDTQRPEERIKWRVSQGITHSGVVTFHELAPRLTRIELNLDVDPGSLIEKAARGMRHVKRAARADLHRFKAFIEMQELETGAWRGVIEDGELVEPHDDSYDEERDYSDAEDLLDDSGSADDKDEDQEKGEGNGSSRERSQRFKRQAERSRGGGSSSGRSRSSGKSGGPKASSSRRKTTSRD
jgi:cobalamin biosynthesis protein CobT